MENLWHWLTEPTNREVLTWIGGGVVVLLGGLWVFFKFLHGESPSVSADHGSTAAGRDAFVNQPNRQTRPKP